MIRATAATGSKSLIEYGTPVYGLWAEDPAETPVADAVQGTWTNFGSDAEDWMTRFEDPVWRASVSDLGDRPSFDMLKSATDGEAFQLDYAAVSAISMPGSIISVCTWHTAADSVHDADRNAPAQGWMLKNGGSTWQIQAGGTASSAGTIVANTAYLVVADYVDGDALLRVNGTNIITGASIGTNTMQGMSVGTRQGSADYWNGYIAFCALHPYRLTTQTWFAAYERAVAAHYGITLA